MTRSVALSTTLRDLRTRAGLSGVEAGRRAGLSQATISRFETGTRVPSVDEMGALCKAYRAPADVRRTLQATVRDLEATNTSARLVLQRPRRMQEKIGRVEQSADLIRSFQSGMVIGLLQTTDYVRSFSAQTHSGPELDVIVQARIQRQRVISTSKRFTLVHAEGALRWHVGSPTIMANQLDHLAAMTEVENVRLGVIPWDRPVAQPIRHAFHIYDHRTVIVGTESGTAFINDRIEVRAYDRRFNELDDVAVYGAAARQIFLRIAAEYRALPVAG